MFLLFFAIQFNHTGQAKTLCKQVATTAATLDVSAKKDQGGVICFVFVCFVFKSQSLHCWPLSLQPNTNFCIIPFLTLPYQVKFLCDNHVGVEERCQKAYEVTYSLLSPQPNTHFNLSLPHLILLGQVLVRQPRRC
jgi:hypothetical protein